MHVQDGQTVQRIQVKAMYKKYCEKQYFLSLKVGKILEQTQNPCSVPSPCQEEVVQPQSDQMAQKSKTT